MQKPVEDPAQHFDVVVVGGGPAGLAAAWAATDQGARVVVLETAGETGGNITGAFVHTICGLYAPAETGSHAFVNPGLPARFATALQAVGAAGEAETVGKVRVVPTDPGRIRRVIEQWCAARPGLRVRLGVRIHEASLALADARTNTFLGQDATGSFRITSDIVVDTTGDAALAQQAGASVEGHPDSERQLPSYIARLAGVPAADTAGYGRLRWTAALARAARKGALDPRAESALLRPVPGSKDAFLTLNLSRSLVLETPRERLAEEAGRTVDAVVAHLRANREGYSDCHVVASPRHEGRREGTRMRGRSRVAAEDVLAGTRSEDEVALSSWPIELWQDHRRATFRHIGAPCGIPLGALVSASHPRLGTAGRCLSASHEALGALRVIGTALATGEAVGIASALAADRGIALAEVVPADVRLRRDATISG